MNEELKLLIFMLLFFIGLWRLSKIVKKDAHEAYRQKRLELEDRNNEKD